MQLGNEIVDVLLLAGGRNSRMGGQFKGGLRFREEAFLSRILASLQDGEGNTFLSYASADAAPFLPEGCRILYDPYRGIGPIAGLIAGLEACATEYLAVAACDMPLLCKELYQYLMEEASQDIMKQDTPVLPDACMSRPLAILPVTEDGLHPLAGIYHRDILPVFESAALQQRYGLHRILRELPVRTVSLTEEPRLLEAVTNINTREDYERLLLVN